MGVPTAWLTNLRLGTADPSCLIRSWSGALLVSNGTTNDIEVKSRIFRILDAARIESKIPRSIVLVDIFESKEWKSMELFLAQRMLEIAL